MKWREVRQEGKRSKWDITAGLLSEVLLNVQTNHTQTEKKFDSFFSLLIYIINDV